MIWQDDRDEDNRAAKKARIAKRTKIVLSFCSHLDSNSRPVRESAKETKVFASFALFAFFAASNLIPTRRAIVEKLSEGPLSVSQFDEDE